MFGDVIVDVQAGQQDAQEDQRDGADEPGLLLLHARIGLQQLHDDLCQGADASADQKRFQAVGKNR